MDNRHTQAISKEIIDEVKGYLASAKTMLQSYCVTLTAEQRQSLPKMSDGTFIFGAKALEHATNHPEFLPGHISLEEWKLDMADVTNLKQIAVLLGDLDQMVDDTRMVAGSEAYFAGRGYYHSVQRAAADGVQGAKPIDEDLRPFFRSKGIRSKSDGK